MALTNECIPLFEDADRLTVRAVQPISGKRFLAPGQNFLSGPGMPAAAQVGASDPVDGGNIQAIHAPAGSRALGVSTWDVLEGEDVGCIAEGIVPVTAGGTILAGEEVMPGPEGKAVVWASGAGAAVLKTGEVGGSHPNTAIEWTAIKTGTAPKIIIAVAGNNTAFSIAVSGEKVTINVATGASGESLTTATEAIEKANENKEVTEKVTAANYGTSTGAGALAAVAETALSGTTDTTQGSSGLAVSGATSGNDVFVKLHC
jgi:hypothetical protein